MKTPLSYSAGTEFRKALDLEAPLQIIGVSNPYVALMAEKVGYRALYLSGAGIANFSHALPDIGLTTLEHVVEDARRITQATELPLLVDIDTGWGTAASIIQAIQSLTEAGVAGIHIEDQVLEKRCGHLSGKKCVSTEEMCARLQAAVKGKTDPGFVIMARTDSLTEEGIEKALKRAIRYRKAGAEMLFAEAVTSLTDYQRFRDAFGGPILANLTEFGKTPLWSLEEMKKAGVDMVLYPLSVARSMNFAALEALKMIRSEGTQEAILPQMQTRKDLYEFLNYEVEDGNSQRDPKKGRPRRSRGR